LNDGGAIRESGEHQNCQQREGREVERDVDVSNHSAVDEPAATFDPT
jgi:hypothetical protein